MIERARSLLHDEEPEEQHYRGVKLHVKEKDPFRAWELANIKNRGHSPVTESTVEDYL